MIPTYFICEFGRSTTHPCTQLGRTISPTEVEGFSVVLHDPSDNEDIWPWGHVDYIDKTMEIPPGYVHHELCEAAWTAFELGSREAAYNLLRPLLKETTT